MATGALTDVQRLAGARALVGERTLPGQGRDGRAAEALLVLEQLLEGHHLPALRGREPARACVVGERQDAVVHRRRHPAVTHEYRLGDRHQSAGVVILDPGLHLGMECPHSQKETADVVIHGQLALLVAQLPPESGVRELHSAARACIAPELDRRGAGLPRGPEDDCGDHSNQGERRKADGEESFHASTVLLKILCPTRSSTTAVDARRACSSTITPVAPK